MKILIDIGHPSFVHLFRKSARALMESGHDVLFSARNKSITYDLLCAYDLPFVCVGHNYSTLIGKIFGAIANLVKLSISMLKFKPDLVMSGASPYAALVSFVLMKQHFVFDDTENKEQVMFFKLGCDLILTPESFSVDMGKRHIRYPGLHELAYLPEEFNSTEDTEKPLVFFRFVNFNATHDLFRRGLSVFDKQVLVDYYSKTHQVLISSEHDLSGALARYTYRGRIEDIHAYLSRAVLCISESATMAAEAACLNVPTLYYDPSGTSYTHMLEKEYGLIQNLDVSEKSLKISFLEIPVNSSHSYERFLNENINLSAFIIWLAVHAKNKNLLDLIKSVDFFTQFKTLGKSL